MKGFFVFLIWTLGVCCRLDAQVLYIEYAGNALSDETKERIEKMMDFEKGFYSSFGLPDTLRVRLTVFIDREDGLDYLDSLGVGKVQPLQNVGGLYNNHRREAVILGLKEEEPGSLSTIYHELSNFLTRQVLKNNPPAWLMDGLGEYFEHCNLGKRGVKHSLDTYEKGRIRTMYMSGEVNLKEFVDAGRKKFMKQQRTDEQSAYILAHALVTFLIEKMPRSLLVDLFASFDDKTNLAPVSEKIGLVYPGGFAVFEKDFAKLFQ